MAQTELQKDYTAGQISCLRCEPSETNPYKKGTPQYRAWERGYQNVTEFLVFMDEYLDSGHKFPSSLMIEYLNRIAPIYPVITPMIEKGKLEPGDNPW